MKKMLLFLVLFVSSFFFVGECKAYITAESSEAVNTFSLNLERTYTVIHKQMDLNGTTYTAVLTETGTASVGDVITPGVQTYQGFTSPTAVTVTIDYNGDNIITYLYERKQYTLTIQDSEYVTTSTPSGTYYYGQEIHLMADQRNSQGADFEKWSNGVENRELSFIMTEDVTLRPLYGTPYTIYFDPNGGSPNPGFIERYENEPLGTLPTVKNDDCQGTEGSYEDRQCTYFYKFEGWYTEPTFENQVNADYVPNDNITLYAKWNKVYYHNDRTTFTGNNMLDTGIALFSEENASKDFIVTFTLDSMNSSQVQRAVLFANLDETGQPFAGTMFRRHNNNRQFEIVANVSTGNGMGHRKTDNVSDSSFGVGQTFVLVRENGKLYYSLDGGNTFTLYNDFTNFSNYFDTTATFGGEYDENQNPYRYFKGTLSNMTVELTEPRVYTVHFDANGGEGMMLDQNYALHESSALRENSYTRQAYVFDHWNTEPDDSGTSYTDGQVVSMLAEENEVVTLYAQWVAAPKYYVAFDANGGTGTMDTQEFTVNVSQALNASQFTKQDYIFDSWNTAPDGSGTRYEEGEEVMNLTTNANDTVTLYAQYGKREYHYSGQITFDGVDDFIDTEVNIYSGVNIDKDFDISFDLIAADQINGSVYQPTIMNAKDESHIISGTTNMVPGFVVRFNGSYSPISIRSRWGSVDGQDSVATANVPIHFEFHRRNGVVTSTYSYNDGANTHTVTLFDQADWILESNCPSTITFGARVKDGVADRFFTGTLANIDVVVYE